MPEDYREFPAPRSRAHSVTAPQADLSKVIELEVLRASVATMEERIANLAQIAAAIQKIATEADRKSPRQRLADVVEQADALGWRLVPKADIVRTERFAKIEDAYRAAGHEVTPRALEYIALIDALGPEEDTA